MTIEISPLDVDDKRVKILIVDDSSYNLFVMGELMQQIKFPPEENKTLHVETALNGQIAVDRVKDQLKVDPVKPYFDFIFLDLQMPVLDGF